MQGIELCPQNIRFEDKGRRRRILLFLCVGVIENVVEAECDINRRFVQPIAEVGKRLLVGKGVMFDQTSNAVLVNGRRKSSVRDAATASSIGMSRTKRT